MRHLTKQAKALLLLLFILMCFAIYAYTHQLKYGLGVTAMNRPVFWGIYIVSFVFLIGISAGGIAIASLSHLVELKRENPLMLNTKTARRPGIKDGALVWVESPYGKVQAKAKLTDGIHPEVVGLQHGFAHWAMGKIAKGRGTSDSSLRQAVSCPLSGQALHKECCVRVYKV